LMKHRAFKIDGVQPRTPKLRGALQYKPHDCTLITKQKAARFDQCPTALRINGL
jgi:hypothetical protein